MDVIIQNNNLTWLQNKNNLKLSNFYTFIGHLFLYFIHMLSLYLIFSTRYTDIN